jgi:hypothetical protein
MTDDARTNIESRIEAQRDKIRRKVSRIVGEKLGLGLVPIARAVRQVGDIVTEKPHLARELALASEYRAAVKQLTDFVIPPASRVDLSGSVVTGALTPDDLAELKARKRPPAESTPE